MWFLEDGHEWYIYTTFQHKKDFDGEDIATNYPRDTIVIIQFFPRDGRMLGALQAMIFNFIMSRLEW